MVDLLLLLGLFEGLLADGLVLLDDGVDLLPGADPFVDELLRVDVENVPVLLDDAVHDGLGEHGFVDLIVTVFTVANDVDHHIFVESGTILCGDSTDMDNSLGIISINVENGGVDNAANISAVRGGSGVSWIGGEANLIIGHDVHGAPVRIN